MTCMRKFARLLRCTILLRTRTCNMHACMYFVCVHVYVCVCVCVCVCVHAHLVWHVQMCVYVCLCIYGCVCLCVCMLIWVYA